MLIKMNCANGGGGGYKTVSDTFQSQSGSKTVTVSGISEIYAVCVCLQNNNAYNSSAIITENGYEYFPYNAYIAGVNNISGNSFDFTYDGATTCEYFVIGN